MVNLKKCDQGAQKNLNRVEVSRVLANMTHFTSKPNTYKNEKVRNFLTDHFHNNPKAFEFLTKVACWMDHRTGSGGNNPALLLIFRNFRKALIELIDNNFTLEEIQNVRNFFEQEYPDNGHGNLEDMFYVYHKRFFGYQKFKKIGMP